MRTRSRIVTVTALAVMLLWAAPPPAQAQVMDQVPSDALVVLRIKNLDQANKKVAKFAKGLGLDQMDPRWADPLGALEQEAKVGKGVNRGGDLAVAFLDPDKFGGNPEQSIVVLVPVSDYKGFLGNFKDTADEGGVTRATPQEGGDEVFLAQWGKYAALSPNKAIVARKPSGGIKLQGAAAKESDAKDAIIYVNMKAVSPKLLPQLREGREQAMQQVVAALEAEDNARKFVPVAKAFVNQLLNLPERFLTDARSATIGLSLVDEGITSTVMAEFEPGSYLGKLAAGIKNTDGPLTAGLPDRRYFMVGGGAADPKTTAQLLTDVVDPITAELRKIEEARPFMAAIDAWKKAAASMTGQSFGWVAPQGRLGEESLIQQVQVLRGDAKTIHESMRQTLKAMSEVFKMIPPEAGGGAAVTFNIKPGGKSVAGVALDTYETKINLPEDNPGAAEAKQMMALIYGPAGQTGVMGAVDPKTFIAVQGGNEKLITDTVAAAKANDDKLANQAGVKMVSAQLPKSRAGVAYVNLEAIVNTGIQAGQQFGALPPNLRVKPNLPPIGMAIASEGSAIRIDGFVPNALIQGLMTAGLEAQRAFEGGGAPGL
jgi:hypothetical protein